MSSLVDDETFNLITITPITTPNIHRPFGAQSTVHPSVFGDVIYDALPTPGQGANDPAAPPTPGYGGNNTDEEANDAASPAPSEDANDAVPSVIPEGFPDLSALRDIAGHVIGVRIPKKAPRESHQRRPRCAMAPKDPPGPAKNILMCGPSSGSDGPAASKRPLPPQDHSDAHTKKKKEGRTIRDDDDAMSANATPAARKRPLPSQDHSDVHTKKKKKGGKWTVRDEDDDATSADDDNDEEWLPDDEEPMSDDETRSTDHGSHKGTETLYLIRGAQYNLKEIGTTAVGGQIKATVAPWEFGVFGDFKKSLVVGAKESTGGVRFFPEGVLVQDGIGECILSVHLLPRRHYVFFLVVFLGSKKEKKEIKPVFLKLARVYEFSRYYTGRHKTAMRFVGVHIFGENGHVFYTYELRNGRWKKETITTHLDKTTMKEAMEEARKEEERKEEARKEEERREKERRREARRERRRQKEARREERRRRKEERRAMARGKGKSNRPNSEEQSESGSEEDE